MNLPNLLTLSRIALIPVFVWVFFSSLPHPKLLALGVYLIAGVTDLLDGYLSRKLNQVTTLGMVLDPLADKLMLIAVLVCLVAAKLLPLWILMTFVVKETMMIAGGLYLWFKKENTAVPADYIGKLATMMLYIALSVTLINISKSVSLICIIIAVGVNGIAFYRYAGGFKKMTDSSFKK